VNTYRFPVVIESDSDGFFAYCPDLQGCYTQGRTFEEAIANIRDAVRLNIEYRLDMGEAIRLSTRHFDKLRVSEIERLCSSARGEPVEPRVAHLS
jgi:predicted RNase H-like HicB family nuclease